ncbi:hypothetical protein SY212_04760 [Ligilactobacillus agilis]|uniref:Uncharacterized protein n=1 Tax=Ligilactobacillus agilis TaxID=1601 RepID=A0A6F9XJM2_9LACO|nr:hypothetical protein SY212_04760 [Ligilactobacillus agilis]
MLYPYATFPGYLIVTFSQVIKDKGPNGKEKVIVNFEQPDDETGFNNVFSFGQYLIYFWSNEGNVLNLFSVL